MIVWRDDAEDAAFITCAVLSRWTSDKGDFVRLVVHMPSRSYPFELPADKVLWVMAAQGTYSSKGVLPFLKRLLAYMTPGQKGLLTRLLKEDQ